MTQNGVGRQVSAAEPCILCGNERYCLQVFDLSDDIYRVVCHKTQQGQEPDEWRYYGQSRDGRQKFIKKSYRRARVSKKYPAKIELLAEAKEIPQWQDVPAPPIDKACKGSLVILKPEAAIGDRHQVYEVTDLKFQKSTGTLNAILKAAGGLGLTTVVVSTKDIQEIVTYDGSGREQFIEYVYSETLKVVRTQWTDRRPVYPGKQTKNVRPYHFKDGVWTIGKGDIDFPLYRQEEAESAIQLGLVIFAVGGEQAVESLRSLGLTATCNQGGEKSSRQVAQKLSPTFKSVARLQAADTGDVGEDGEPVGMANCKPLLVTWGDNDPTGRESTTALLKECRKTGIIGVAIDPINLWTKMPLKGDAKDWLDHCRQEGMSDDEIRFRLAEAVEEAIDRAEEDAKYRWQRQGWNAPCSLNGEIGFWEEDKQGLRYWNPCCNFDFQVERELQDTEGGGLVLQVKRSLDIDEDQQQIILNSCDYTTPDKFSDAMKKALGTGIVCNLTKSQLNALIHTRSHEYRTNRKGKKYRRIECYGQQEDGIWVFGDRQFTRSGELIAEETSGWVYNPKVGKDGDIIPCPKQAPIDPNALTNLVSAMRKFFGAANIHQTLLMMGWVIAGIHSQAIFDHDNCFPLFNGHGEPGSCKTLAAETCLSLVGTNWAEDGMLARTSVSKVYELLSRTGSLPFIWDDPDRSPENEEIMKTLYNRKARQVRGNEQKPKSPLGICSNHIAGGDQAATYTRIARVGFERANSTNKGSFQELKAAQRKASGAFQLILQMGYDPDAIATIEHELLWHLPTAHARIAQSLAIVIHYAQKVVNITGGTEDLKAWTIQNICQGENSADSSGDSIEDFASHIEALEAESMVGDWNKKVVFKGSDRFVAIHHSDVWSLVDDKFHPATYNKKSLKSQLLKAGGRESTEQFAISKDEVLAYHRLLLNAGTGTSNGDGDKSAPTPPRRTARSAWLIPAKYFDFDEPLPPTDRGGGGGDNQPKPPQPPTDNGGLVSFNQFQSIPIVSNLNLIEPSNIDRVSFSASQNPTSIIFSEKVSLDEEKKLEAPKKKEEASNFLKGQLRDENGLTVEEAVKKLAVQGLDPSTNAKLEMIGTDKTVEPTSANEVEDIAEMLKEAIAANSPEMLADIRAICSKPELLNQAAKSLGAEGHAIIKRWVLEQNQSSATATIPPAATEYVQNHRVQLCEEEVPDIRTHVRQVQQSWKTSPQPKRQPLKVGDFAKFIGSDDGRRNDLLAKYRDIPLEVKIVDPKNGIVLKDFDGTSTTWFYASELDKVNSKWL